MIRAQDPSLTIAQSPMSRTQYCIIALCIALNAMDGFDVLAISFAAPGIAEEWGINRAVLGVVLSMELIGMAIGSVLLGNLADKFGRRPIIITCLSVMAAGMFLSAAVNSVWLLSALRLFTGLGIGGMLSATSATVAEFSNERRHGLMTILNIAGYPLGAILGGSVASALLAYTGEWRAIFIFGGSATLLLLPLVIWYLPETVQSNLARRPVNALKTINDTMKRMQMPTLQALPDVAPQQVKPSILSLFSENYRLITLALTTAYFAQIMAFYFIQKWTPKIVVDLGFEPASAGTVLVMANIGSLCGAISLGLASSKINMSKAVMSAMLTAFFCFAAFGIGYTDLAVLSLLAAVTVFFTNAGVVGMYPIMAKVFPSELRASGTGFVIGVGRGGSALGPIIAGALFDGGSSLLLVSIVMGAGTLLAAAMVLIATRASGSRQGAAVTPG